MGEAELTADTPRVTERPEVAEATWGVARGRGLHYDPLLHVLVGVDRVLCTGNPGVRRHTSRRVPSHSCRRCLREWAKQNADEGIR